ncbi:MAG TPA: serine hydrolase domain-containing protein, partial [Candidatus Binatia bacterium]|nr:serine hydrolase domain-containing protein [Candidatus Binatia bacterium]
MRRVTTAVFGLFLLSGFALSGWSNHQTGFDAVWNQGHALYRTLLKQHGIVGSSLVVLHDGVVVAEDYVGLANEEKGWPVDRDTIYHWASNTKTLTGIAIMQLRDRGLLSLDDPVTKYIPELRKVHNPFGSMDAITIRHLMTHSAGFRSATWPWGGEPWHPHEPLHWSQLEAMFPYTEILFEPGKEFRYSNPGVVFLGRIIELLTTDDYEVYIDKNIFSPLEMHRSYFDNTPYYLSRHKAQGYTRST